MSNDKIEDSVNKTDDASLGSEFSDWLYDGMEKNKCRPYPPHIPYVRHLSPITLQICWALLWEGYDKHDDEVHKRSYKLAINDILRQMGYQRVENPL